MRRSPLKRKGSGSVGRLSCFSVPPVPAGRGCCFGVCEGKDVAPQRDNLALNHLVVAPVPSPAATCPPGIRGPQKGLLKPEEVGAAGLGSGVKTHRSPGHGAGVQLWHMCPW